MFVLHILGPVIFKNIIKTNSEVKFCFILLVSRIECLNKTFGLLSSFLVFAFDNHETCGTVTRSSPSCGQFITTGVFV